MVLAPLVLAALIAPQTATPDPIPASDALRKRLVALAMPRCRQRVGRPLTLYTDFVTTDGKGKALLQGYMKDAKGRPARDRTTASSFVTAGFRQIKGKWSVHFIRFKDEEAAKLMKAWGYDHLTPPGCAWNRGDAL